MIELAAAVVSCVGVAHAAWLRKPQVRVYDIGTPNRAAIEDAVLRSMQGQLTEALHQGRLPRRIEDERQYADVGIRLKVTAEMERLLQ